MKLASMAENSLSTASACGATACWLALAPHSVPSSVLSSARTGALT